MEFKVFMYFPLTPNVAVTGGAMPNQPAPPFLRNRQLYSVRLTVVLGFFTSFSCIYPAFMLQLFSYNLRLGIVAIATMMTLAMLPST
jgi:hypothetical protein